MFDRRMNGCGQLCCVLKCQSHYYQAFFSREGSEKCEDKLGRLNGRLITKEHFKQLTLDSETEYSACVCSVCVGVTVSVFDRVHRMHMFLPLATTLLLYSVQ